MSVNIQAKHTRARDNRAYVRELLAERQPGLAALLRAVERQLDAPLPHDPRDWRRTMNTAWLYHLDGFEQEEVAAIVGVSRRTVATRLAQFSSNARKFVRRSAA